MEKQKVIEHFGGIKPAASAYNITIQAIYRWPDVIPELRARQAEDITDGQLKFDESFYSKAS